MIEYSMVLTYKNKFNTKYGFSKDEPHSIAAISKITGYKLSGLKTIFSKGVGAYKTSPQSVRPNVSSKEQWAYARVYSAVTPKSKASVVDASHLKPKIGYHIMPSGAIMSDKLHS